MGSLPIPCRAGTGSRGAHANQCDQEMEGNARATRHREGDLGRQILTLSFPLEDAEDLDPLLERIDNARYVLLGEASHGTHEYYLWRTRISGRLIAEKGFRFIAVEGGLARLLPCQLVHPRGVRERQRRGCAAWLRPLADVDVGKLGNGRICRLATKIQ